MLSSADRAFVETDPVLVDLGLLLDPETLATALRAAVPSLPAAAIRLSYLRHKSAMSCLAGYELEVDGRTRYLHAKTVAPAWGSKLTRMAAGGARLGEFGFGQTWLASGRTLVRELPNDARLAAPALDDSCTILRYKPERRLVVRRESGAERQVLKAYAPREYPNAALGAAAFRSEGSLRLAPVLNVDAERRTVVSGYLPGRLLTEELQAGRVTATELEGVGRALAELHAQPARLERVRSPDDEAAALLRIADEITRLMPAAREQIRRLSEELARRLRESRPRLAPTHGDFYAQQVLLDGSRIGVLDFDEAALGDPAADLGNFLAHLERDALRGRMSPGLGPVVRERLLAGYARHAPLPTGVILQTAIALLRVSHLPFRHRESAWPAQIQALLDRATELAAQATPTAEAA